MKFVSATALLSLLPISPTVSAWGLLGRSPLSLMRPMVVYSPSTLLDRQEALMNRAFTQTSPRYEITDNDEKFQVAVDVPGFKVKDVQVSVDDKHGPPVLTISGSREQSGDTYSFSSKFSQSFSLNPDVVADKFSANLKDGVLVITAPKDLKRIEESVRTIPITEAAHHDEITPKEEAIAETEVKVEEKVEETKAENVPVEMK